MSESTKSENAASCLNESLIQFACSTPIKLGSLDENELNLSAEFLRVNKRSLLNNEPISKMDELLFGNNKDANSSLIEFEQNERLVEMTLSNSRCENPKLKEPIEQMQNLLLNLRGNFDCDKFNDDLIDNFELKLASRILPLSSRQLFNSSGSFECEKNVGLNELEKRLESEKFRREYCEKEVKKLNDEVLELKQSLAVSVGNERKNAAFLKQIDSGLIKLLDEWKQKENMIEHFNLQMKKDKEKMMNNETKSKMRIEILENEMKILSDQLVNEKVKSQEYLNEIISLKKSLASNEILLGDKNSELKQLLEQRDQFDYENKNSKDDIENLKNELTNLKTETCKKEESLLSRIGELTATNKSLLEKNLKIQNEYEKLINEAKLVVNESEKQYNQLVKAIEAERISKDSLQVEINVLEEKLEQTVKILSEDYEKKIKTIEKERSDKEASMISAHKQEINDLNTKFKLEFERIKSKNFNDLQTKIDEYEMKLTDQNLKMDCQLNEMERLKRVNIDLETDRNTIRQNLKKMLQMQMSEAMQLLGVNADLNLHPASKTSTITTPNLEKSIDLNSLIPNRPEIDEIQTGSLSVLLEKLKSDPTDQIFDHLKSVNNSSSNQSRAKESPDSRQNPTEPIKDAFILNQIDLINRYYQIDNNALESFAGSNLSNNALNASLNSVKSWQQVKENKQSFDKNQEIESKLTTDNQSLNTSRATELRHFIGILLNRSPKKEDDSKSNRNAQKFASNSTSSFFMSNFNLENSKMSAEKIDETCEDCDEESTCGEDKESKEVNGEKTGNFYNELSDPEEVGYTKQRRSHGYYDDVKRTLNFDDTPPHSSSDNDGESEEVELYEFRNGTSTPANEFHSLSQTGFCSFSSRNNRTKETLIDNKVDRKTNETQLETKRKTILNKMKNNLKNNQSQSMISLSTSSLNSANLQKTFYNDEQFNSKTHRNSKPAWK